MKILAFAASNSSVSINGTLVRHATQVLQGEFLPNVEVEILDLNAYEMPIYSHDREEAGGIPDLAHAFLAKVGEADGLIISFAEHNGLYTAAFKNIFDWASRLGRDVYQSKPLVALATSPGGRGGTNVLKLALEASPRFGAKIVGSLSVPSFAQSFDAEAGALSDPDLAKGLREALSALSEAMTTAATTENSTAVNQ